MNEDVFDGTEAENLDLTGSGEDVDDYGVGEDYYGEAAFPSPYNPNLARVRAQAQPGARAAIRRPSSMAASHQRRVSYMPPTSSGSASTVHVRQGFGRVSADMQKTQAAVRNVYLDNKVQANAFGRALQAQQERIGRSESSMALSKVVDELKERVPDLFQNEVLKTALPLVPLLFLKPEKKGQGFEGFISDPRVWGPVLTAAIALFGQSQKRTEIAILGSTTVAAGSSIQLTAIARDSNGQPIIPQPNITWTSLNTNFATVSSNGQVTGSAAGSALITATAIVAGKSVTQVTAVEVTSVS